ncbi:hypothetical protein F441_21072 [Phytophthora nicotianae CJ01A1]|uniref:Uncharacterized protein n=5 Tax=Phytophthora nicotianae TaxID=4792 RepID=W2PFX0_PHYN3|nr:hypothetical protein PPTG_18458 [Phytophthora nicotianae INRA-310]ETI31913.1 hypothetical protein F443_21191 [Phytophthora nicotianae P1569]ETK72275.1 hypothetical protein L915_20609 [Phytophthora nicotianae]ETO60628.1 hypothetical protein F444_21212 [Phytophthora nicotianae P1976]ETP01741.1 hypothetical protein F441_21072 [Phytophthora nicotianae CJ01A1]KUF86661.1 hypothetical protein AM587_10004312 [Phytophthora nicotianae]
MDTSALREFAFKKLQEARERGSELAAVTAARAASSISSSVPVSSSFVFRAQSSVEQQQEQLPASLENKLETLKKSNDSLRSTLTGTSSGSLNESIYKLDLINESLAFSIENIQEGSHVMKLLNRQLKDSATMQNPAHKAFYQRNEQSAQ